MAVNLLKTKTQFSKAFNQAIVFKCELTNGTVQKSGLSTTTVCLNSSANDDLSLISAKYKRGTGGRSSYSGQTVCVFGATGVLGRIVVNRLGKQGANVIIPHRSDGHDIRSLKLCGDLGQILFYQFDLKNKDTMFDAVRKSNIVINCIGTMNETRNFSFEQVHVDGARNIAHVARECGVEKLIHVSALNASPNPQVIYMKNGSTFLKTKYAGEQAVNEEFPNAVIIRPSIIYGEMDKFLASYANQLRFLFNSIALWNKGEKTVKMPVHTEPKDLPGWAPINGNKLDRNIMLNIFIPKQNDPLQQKDVASGIMKIVNDRHIQGKTFDFVGPDRYLLSEIVDFTMNVLRRPNVKRTYMSPYYFALAWLCQQSPKRHHYNFEKMELEFISDTLTVGNPKLKDLDIKFQNFSDMAKFHLKNKKAFAYYDESLGEFPDPAPPSTLPDDYELKLA